MGSFNGTYGEVNINAISSNRILFHINEWSSKYRLTLTDTSTDWKHIAFVIDPNVAENNKVYLNGVDQELTSGDSPTFPLDLDFTSRKTIIGAYYNTSYTFGGLISQTALWTKSLTDEEILGIYNLGRRNADYTQLYSDQLKGYWFLNPTHSNPDTTGTDKILDRSGNGNHGNRDGLGFYFTNPSSNVLRLNREHNEYLNLGIFDDNTWKSSFTISFWIKLYDGNIQPLGNNQTIMGTDDTSGADSRIAMDAVYTGTLRVTFESEGTTKTLQSNNSIFSDGANDWKHISIVVNRDTDNGHIYVNDSEVASNGSGLYSGFDTSVLSIQKDFHIGKENRGNNIGISGLLDEVRIYNRALSADEINKNYKHQKGKHKND
jgi:hypothetical protein